ncbi:hypothetical protein Q5O14_11290 [Eubacteriaceae bacterium ES2]|nr:hypothetical protein Q5O14_11290 [Eubacteriaceae bacterium ES2]
MFTLGIKNQLVKTILVYAILSVLLVCVNWIYGLFGHGVDSPYMTFMFLYSLLGGCLFYLALYKSVPRLIESRLFRIFYNLYNSGLAALIVGSLLTGILEIAGTGSDYQKYFFIGGFGLIGIAIMIMAFAIVLQKNADSQKKTKKQVKKIEIL